MTNRSTRSPAKARATARRADSSTSVLVDDVFDRSSFGEGSSVRREILDAAALIFAKKGYSGTSTREVAESLGRQKASLYHYVKSKEDLFYFVCIDALTRAQRAVEAALAKVNNGNLERLRVASVTHLHNGLRDKGTYHIMLRELDELSDTYQQDLMARRAEYEQLFQGVIEAGQEAGEFRSDVSAHFLTQALFRIFRPTTFWYDRNEPTSPDEIGPSLFRLFVEGVRPPAAG